MSTSSKSQDSSDHTGINNSVTGIFEQHADWYRDPSHPGPLGTGQVV